MKTGRVASLARDAHVEQILKAGDDPLEVANVEGALGRQPCLAVLGGLRISRKQDPDRPALLGKVRAPRQICRCDLKDGDRSAVAQISTRRVEEARAQGRPRRGLSNGGGVDDAQRFRRDARAIGRELLQPGRIDERVRHDLLNTESDKTVPRTLAEFLERMPLRERQRAVGDARWQPVVAGDATDLLDDVLGDRDVGAHDRWRRHERVAVGGRRELKATQDIERLGRIDLDPHHARHVGKTHPHVHSRSRVRIAIHHALHLCAGVLAQEAAGARERDRNEVRRELPGEPARGRTSR